MNTILERISCRDFTNKEIEEEKILALLKAGMQAPSACNQQPWHFLVISDRELLNEMSEVSVGARHLAKADKAIVTVFSTASPRAEFISQDMSAATQNILLEATNLGIGSVWIGTYPLKDRYLKVAKLLHIPIGFTPFSIIALGYPEKPFETKPLRYDSKRVHANKWGN